MTPEQLQAAKTRAADVVNGFKRVTDQNARDALKLAEHAEALAARLARVKGLIEAEQARRDAASKTKKRPASANFSDIFGDIFSGLKL